MMASLFLPLVAITSTVFTNPFEVRSNTKAAMELRDESREQDFISGQPDILWPKIVGTIRKWDAVKESDQADPPPLI
jgi:hypothetical protein